MQPTTVDEFKTIVAEISADPEYRSPAAYAIGIAHVSTRGEGTKVLDTYYPVVNLGENEGAAAVLSSLVGRAGGAGSWELDGAMLDRALVAFAPFVDDGGAHPNLDVLRRLAGMPLERNAVGARRVAVVTFIDALDAAPVDAHDVYLRLHLLSHRRVRPHGLSLEGAFGLLANVVWTNHGPADPDGFEETRSALRCGGVPVQVTSIDKFPRMTDYVVPSGVRIADADRVRLGAHLADGTTVMHEGFVNFNAGTLGTAMVEGRISAGVVVGDHSDIGGGASIMGTLSGGGKEVVSVGERCLLGANAGIGISLGDECVVEAGLYVTAGTRVVLPDGAVVKAADLSGRSGLLFRRNSETGAVEVLARGGAWSDGLNTALHQND